MKLSADEQPICGICGSTFSKEVYFWREWNAPKRHVASVGIRKCLKCGVWFTWPVPTPAYGESFDSEYDYQQYKGLPVALRMFRKLLLLAKVEKGLQIYPKGFRLLDVGCNTGVVLELARALGFDAEGFEVSQNAAAISKKKGFRVASDQLDADFAPMTFDVVYASHVIEHLQNPPAFLASVRRILKDKGFLMLACPNRSAIGAWVRRDQHPWDPDVHIYHFRPKDMRSMMRQSSFSIRYFFTEDGTVAYHPFKILAWKLAGSLGLGDTMLIIAQKIS